MLEIIKELETIGDRPRFQSKSAVNSENLKKLFGRKKWQLFDDEWIRDKLTGVADGGYEDSVASVAAKILLRNK